MVKKWSFLVIFRPEGDRTSRGGLRRSTKRMGLDGYTNFGEEKEVLGSKKYRFWSGNFAEKSVKI